MTKQLSPLYVECQTSSHIQYMMELFLRTQMQFRIEYRLIYVWLRWSRDTTFHINFGCCLSTIFIFKKFCIGKSCMRVCNSLTLLEGVMAMRKAAFWQRKDREQVTKGSNRRPMRATSTVLRAQSDAISLTEGKRQTSLFKKCTYLEFRKMDFTHLNGIHICNRSTNNWQYLQATS